MLSRTSFLAAYIKSAQKFLPNLASTTFNPHVVPKRFSSNDSDEPIEIQNPYEREKKVCILCKMNITPDYKNPRLLAQFQSSFTGKMFERNITGLCKKKHMEVIKATRISRKLGYMPYYYKELKYMEDPRLFNPERPFKPHPY